MFKLFFLSSKGSNINFKFHFPVGCLQEYRQFLVLCEATEEDEVQEEIERLFRAVDGGSSSSSSSSKVKKGGKDNTKDQKKREVKKARKIIFLVLSFV